MFDQEIIKENRISIPTWCFPEKLEERSRDFDVQVRRVVAGNKTTPRHVLERLQNDEDVSVKKVAQRTLNS